MPWWWPYSSSMLLIYEWMCWNSQLHSKVKIYFPTVSFTRNALLSVIYCVSVLRKDLWSSAIMAQPPPPQTPTNNNHAPWPVRKGIFRSIGQNDFVPTRSPSPIVEMPMSPSSARSSPARFVPGYNRSMSPRITIEESPFSPPPKTPSMVMSPPAFVNRQSPPLQPPPVIREVPIQSEVISVLRHRYQDYETRQLCLICSGLIINWSLGHQCDRVISSLGDNSCVCWIVDAADDDIRAICQIFSRFFGHFIYSREILFLFCYAGRKCKEYSHRLSAPKIVFHWHLILV